MDAKQLTIIWGNIVASICILIFSCFSFYTEPTTGLAYELPKMIGRGILFGGLVAVIIKMIFFRDKKGIEWLIFSILFAVILVFHSINLFMGNPNSF